MDFRNLQMNEMFWLAIKIAFMVMLLVLILKFGFEKFYIPLQQENQSKLKKWREEELKTEQILKKLDELTKSVNDLKKIQQKKS